MMAVIVAVTACSTVRFTYNNGDTFLYWWLNAYIDIDSEQSGWVKRNIDELFQWHRKTQLQDYAQVLANGQRQLAGNITQADLLADYRDIRTRAERLALKTVPDLADLARSLKPEQIAQLAKKFNSNNESYRKKFLRGDTAKRQNQRFKRTMEQFELWFGNFSRDQEAVLRKASDARPLDNEVWLEERVRRQQMILSLLRRVHDEKLSKEATMAAIQDLIRDIFGRMDAPERKAFYDAQIDGATRMILTAVKIATPDQKAHAQKRMQGWIEDLNALAADAK